jgi:hypothetical protein
MVNKVEKIVPCGRNSVVPITQIQNELHLQHEPNSTERLEQEAWNDYSEEDEMKVLTEFYEATNGASWVQNSNWLDQSVPVSAWFGVGVGDGKVRTLELAGNNLTGSLPASIGQLDKLEIIQLRYNKIGGKVPPEIGKLQNLVIFDCEANVITGPLPDEIGYCVNLEALLLAQNKISGALPETLGYLPKLVDLNLWDNEITSLPPLLPPALRGIGLNHNCLSGSVPVSTIVRCKHLQVLHMHANDFDDATDAQEKIEALLPKCTVVLEWSQPALCCTVQ